MKTAMIGVGLILMGLTALYQMRNGALLYAYQQFFFDPPAAAGLPPAFASLAEMPSATPGVTIGDVATARLLCAEDLLGARPPLPAEVAFHRLNLVLLGAGAGLKAPVIDPIAHYVIELRGDLGRDTAVYRTTPLTAKKHASLVERLGQVSAIEHPNYHDILMSVADHRSGLMVLVDALVSGGLPYHDCVNERKL